jgi:leucyl aminopeptidase
VFVTTLDEGMLRPRRVMLAGAGPRGAGDGTLVRRFAAAASLAARTRRPAAVAFLFTSSFADGLRPLDTNAAAQAVVEGLETAAFETAAYKNQPEAAPLFKRVLIQAEAVAATTIGESVRRGQIVGRCRNLARQLANEPGNRLTPRVFAERVRHLLAGTGLGVEILDAAAIADLGMGLFTGVAQGSHEPPRLIVMSHERPSHGRHLGLVGKGITFDAGGISLKPGKGMERMKDDMAGGAAVVAAMKAIAEMDVPLAVTGLIPAAENMPGGGAIRPGDVLRSANGKTVEVLDTDAEGRLVLADSLWYARSLGVTHLVDIATLTGACMVALGASASGLFAVPSEWLGQVQRAAEGAGERVWPMPLFDDYRDQLQSDIADMVNVGGRPAGASTAAMFLKEFAGNGPWAHIDIAGTAWQEDAKPYMPKGPTGAGVGTLTRLALDLAGER